MELPSLAPLYSSFAASHDTEVIRCRQFCQDDYICTKRCRGTHWLTRLAKNKHSQHHQANANRLHFSYFSQQFTSSGHCHRHQAGQIASTTLPPRLLLLFLKKFAFSDDIESVHYYYDHLVATAASSVHFVYFTRFQKYHYFKAIRTKYKKKEHKKY